MHDVDGGVADVDDGPHLVASTEEKKDIVKERKWTIESIMKRCNLHCIFVRFFILEVAFDVFHSSD